MLCYCVPQEQLGDVNDLLNRVQLLPSHKLWIVLMMGGGHFAAAVFDKYVWNIGSHSQWTL